jgi:hypothetical protein
MHVFHICSIRQGMIKRAIATMVCNFNVLLMVQSQAGFFFNFVSTWIGNHLQEGLAEFH